MKIAVLEAGLTAFSRVLRRALRDAGSGAEPVAAGAEGGVRDERDLALMPGAGAAGGVGFAALAVLRAERRSGVDVVVDLVRLRDRLVGADLVITGEGSFDEQSRRRHVDNRPKHRDQTNQMTALDWADNKFHSLLLGLSRQLHGQLPMIQFSRHGVECF